jgi:lipopolysaccharide export system ATP-binding protein
MSKLQAINIYKSYGKKQILKGINIEVNSGEVVALLGPNGAGKTTFFYSLIGLVNISKGNIILNSEDITNYPIYLRGQMGLGYLPQENSIFRDMSVQENILSILEIKHKDKILCKKKLKKLLTEFGLTRIRNSNAESLSGGERRRVEIARCLASDPNFVLLDEPFAGVDPISVADIRNLVLHLKERDIGVIITDHNVRETLDVVDRAYIIFDGKVLCEGKKEDILANNKVRKFYLGDNFKV